MGQASDVSSGVISWNVSTYDGVRPLCFDIDSSTWKLVFIQVSLMLVMMTGATCHSLDKDG